MSDPRACDRCLRRSWLIGSLSGHIESSLEARPGSLPRELLRLSDQELAGAVGGRDSADFLGRARERDPTRLRTAIRGAHCWACCRHDDAFPERLLELSDVPAVLFGRGDRKLLEALGERSTVTVVGSRRPSGYGQEIAKRLGAELASAGAVVVSGMALGIDSCAHLGALGAGGRTVAVLGGGAELPTPASLGRLYERIVQDGLVISELPPGTTPRRWTFPARNRIMAALSAMTVVVEARHRSGSLITADLAGQLGRDVGSVPGQVGTRSATGTNSLLRDGAHLIRDAQDVLDSLLGPGHGTRAKRPVDRTASLEPSLAAVLEQVELGATGPDAIASTCGLDPEAACSALVSLELEGLIRSDSAGRFRPAAEG